MTTIELLIVEDDQSQINIYQDAIDDFNHEHNGTHSIQATTSKNADDSISLLRSSNFDAIFIDLILENDPSIASGNKVVCEIITNKNLRLISYIISGTLHSLRPEFEGIFNNPLMNKFDRTQMNTDELLQNLLTVHQTGITKVLGTNGTLQKHIDEIFRENLAYGFSQWVKQSPETGCTNELIRFMSGQIQSRLDLDIQGNEIEYYPAEFYIHPKNHNHITNGDIIEINGDRRVILSPACDLALREKGSRNVEFAITAKILPISKTHFEQPGIAMQQNKWIRLTENLKKNNKDRYHYIPEYMEIDEGAIDFKQLQTHLIDDIQVSKTCISSTFQKEIQSRFARYYSRQGQPTLNLLQ